jgi:uncharacterized membrane protein
VTASTQPDQEGAAAAQPDDDESERKRRHAGPDRVVAFTDGVFAIIITLLVLEVAVPADLDDASLRQAISDLWPTLIAWVVSFLLTGMYWVAHRDAFASVRLVTRELVWLNLLFLLPASLIPFAASVLGSYPDEPLALYLFGAVMTSTSLMRIALVLYVLRRPVLLWPSERALDAKHSLKLVLAAAPVAIYGLAMAVTAVAPSVAVALYASVPLLYFLLISVLRRDRRTRATAEEFS